MAQIEHARAPSSITMPGKPPEWSGTRNLITARRKTLAPAADDSAEASPKRPPKSYIRRSRSAYERVLHVRLIVPRHPRVPHLQTTLSTSLSNR